MSGQPTTNYVDKLKDEEEHTHTTINNSLTINGSYLSVLSGIVDNPSINIGNSISNCLRLYFDTENSRGKIGLKGGAFITLSNTKMSYGGGTTLYDLTVNNTLTTNGTLKVLSDQTIDEIVDGTFVASFGLGFKMSYGNDGGDGMCPCLDFIIPSHSGSHSQDYEWRIMPYGNHHLYFLKCTGVPKAYISADGDDFAKLNRTITHNAPIDGELSEFKVGAPVFMNGWAHKLDENGEYSILTDSTNCIPGVKSTGTYKEFLGICTAIHNKGDTVTVGDVMKHDVVINQDNIDFATHGDFYFTVDASIKYHVGDTVLYDGTILDDEEPLTNKIKRMIVGVVTTLIDDVTLAMFKA